MKYYVFIEFRTLMYVVLQILFTKLSVAGCQLPSLVDIHYLVGRTGAANR